MKKVALTVILIAAFIIPNSLKGQEDRWESGRREEVLIGLSPSAAGLGLQGKSVFEIKDKWQIGVFGAIGYFASFEYAVGLDLYFYDRFYFTLGVGPIAFGDVTRTEFIGSIPFETTEFVSFYGFYQMLNYDIRLSNTLALQVGAGYGFGFEDIAGNHFLTSLGLKYTYNLK